jgi:hypothetical protein
MSEGILASLSINEAQKVEILSRMMKSHKEVGMGFADELRKVVPQVFTSGWIGDDGCFVTFCDSWVRFCALVLSQVDCMVCCCLSHSLDKS